MDNQTSKPKNPPKRYPRPRRKEVRAAWGRQRREVPDAALWLAEDVVRLDLVLHLIKQINPLHIGNIMTQTQRDSCGRSVRTTTAVIKGWKATAWNKLRQEHLTP
jgi:hypothetical protein